MKRPEWLFVGSLLLVGAYFSYKYFSKPEVFDPLQLVPKSSVAVYETRNLPNVYSSLKSTEYWQDIDDLSEFDIVSQLAVAMDSIIEKDKHFMKVLKTDRTLISLHVTGNESAALMFYLPTGVGSRRLFEVAMGKCTSLRVDYSTRVYASLTLHELTSGDHMLTYLNHNDYAIVSTVGYLVEDVVRNLNDNLKDNFFSVNPRLIKAPKLDDDAGNLYLNGQQLSAFYQTMLPALHSQVGNLAKSIFFDLNLANKEIMLSGFLFENGKDEFASIFINQEASFPTSIKLVPDNAALVMSINVSDATAWYKAWAKRFPLQPDKDDSSDLGRDFVKNISGDITLATFSSNDKTKNDKLLFIKLADKEGMLNVLNKQAEDIAEHNGDSVYFELYAEHKIGLIERQEFLSEIFGTPFSGFSSTYFMVFQEYVIFASSAERIKKWLNDLDDDNVWGRSVDINSFIDENLGETSFALVFNNPWNWSLSLGQFNEKHKHWWQKSERAIKQFGLASYQFTNLDNKFYTAVNVLHQPIIVETGQQDLNDGTLTQFSNRIISKPKLVKNHVDGSWEVLIQDSVHQISLLDKNGEILWQESLADVITTNIYQIDYFNNRKLQYLFATDSAIYVIDRNGDIIDGLPVYIEDFSIAQLHVIDYDHSRNYRFLIADNSGNLRMYNQAFEVLDGWNPLALNSALSNQFYHVRVRGKDRILIAKQNGIVELRNRKGELQSQFPIDLQYNIENPIHFKVSSTFESSRFTTVSLDGMLTQFDLNGRLYVKKQLDQPSGSSQFSLILDAVQNAFIIARQDLNRLSFLTKNGEIIFEKDFQDTSVKEVQYYSLGVDKQLYIVRDIDSGKVHLYNKNGSLINSNSIISKYPVSIVYRKSQAKCYIYTAVEQSVEVNYFSF